MDVYKDDAFEDRVNYAASCIVRGTTHGRHFDTCFEMNDGDFVAAALVRRVVKNPTSQLAARIFEVLNRECALASYERLKRIPRRKLAAAAAEHREQCRKEFDEYPSRQQLADDGDDLSGGARSTCYPRPVSHTHFPALITLSVSTK